MSGSKPIDGLSLALDVLAKPANLKTLRVKLQDAFEDDPVAFFNRYGLKPRPVAPGTDDAPPAGLRVVLARKKAVKKKAGRKCGANLKTG